MIQTYETTAFNALRNGDMKKIILAFVILLLCSMSSMSHGDSSCDDSRCVIQYQSATVLPRELIKSDVHTIWNWWLDEQGVNKNHPGRKRLEKFAGHVADAVTYYQTHKTNVGGILPLGRDTHIIIAVKVIKETAIKPWVIGKKRHEVGLMQVHGEALDGHRRREVINNPRLGVFLGVRWLAYHAQFCGKDPTAVWTAEDWLGTLTIYGAGLRAGRKGKECKIMSFAIRRVNTTIKYREMLLDTERNISVSAWPYNLYVAPNYRYIL